MILTEFANQYEKLCFAFDKEVKQGQVQVYFEYLGHFKFNAMIYAVNKAILYNKFFPKISELVDLINEYREALPVERQLSEGVEEGVPPPPEFIEAKEKLLSKVAKPIPKG